LGIAHDPSNFLEVAARLGRSAKDMANPESMYPGSVGDDILDWHFEMADYAYQTILVRHLMKLPEDADIGITVTSYILSWCAGPSIPAKRSPVLWGALAFSPRLMLAARYVALNPVRARLVQRPQDWA